MTDRIVDRPLRSPGPAPTVGPCGWLEDGETCAYDGPLLRGLCRRHYDMLRHRAEVVEARRMYEVDDLPTTCGCRYPIPIACRIIGARIIVPGAYECLTCGRAVL